jgi:adenine phosphoribosyltransferase
VLVVDDLLAKGGTAVACSRLVEAAGAVSACLFFIELALLRGAERLAPRPIFSLLRYGADPSLDPWFSILNRPA